MAKESFQKPPLWRSLISELFGTFALTFVDCGGAVIEKLDTAGDVTAVGRGLATGLTVMALIYSLGPTSGAHVNPAATAAFALRGVFSWRRVPLYWIAQLAGAIGAALLLLVLFGSVERLGSTQPHFGAAPGLVLEIALTLLLVTVILSTATLHRILGSDAALAVGGTVALCALFSRPISGASMNPARSLGPALVSGYFADQWIYLVGPFVGAALAVVLVGLLHGSIKPGEAKAATGDAESESRPA